MTGALIYLQWHSFRNRLVMRFKRLKNPKYLIGAIFGAMYFYFYFFRYIFGGGFTGKQRAAAMSLFPPDYLQLIEAIGTFALFVIVVLAWILPHERAALAFTEAEVAFLFPAPVSRRTLIHFKLIRSQIAIFFSAFFLTLFTRRYGGNVLIHAFGWWLALSTLNLHFLGASFVRTMLLDRGVSNNLRRLLVLVLATLLCGGVWFWVKNSLPPMNFDPTEPFNSIFNYLRQILQTDPAMILLYPFHLVVHPFFTANTSEFLVALAPALLIFLLHYFWVIFSNVAFEEASLEASQKLAARMAAVRSGNWQAARQKQKARRAWFQLAPNGAPQIALLWKNLIGIGQTFSPRFLIIIGVVLIVFFMTIGKTSESAGISTICAIIIAVIVGYSMLIGPQFLRLDFRRDLPQADILKTYPLRGWQIALGEILAPVVMLAAFQWLLLLVGIATQLIFPGKHTGLALAIGIGAAIVIPVMDFLLLMIPNAAVLLFPSWIQAGKDAPRGIEATGQRLIFAIGQLLTLLVALIPASIAFAIVFFLMKFAIGMTIAIPFAAIAAAIVLAVEAFFGVMLLGKLFERFDVTEEQMN